MIQTMRSFGKDCKMTLTSIQCKRFLQDWKSWKLDNISYTLLLFLINKPWLWHHPIEFNVDYFRRIYCDWIIHTYFFMIQNQMQLLVMKSQARAAASIMNVFNNSKDRTPSLILTQIVLLRIWHQSCLKTVVLMRTLVNYRQTTHAIHLHSHALEVG